MKTTFWRCDRCGKTGHVMHDDHADVYTVINNLENDHDAAANAFCLFDLSMVRVNPNKIPPRSRTARETTEESK
jgi:hypothetical protein